MKVSVRYEAAIYAKLKMLQAKIEFERASRDFDKHITVAESKGLIDGGGAKEVMTNMLNRADIEVVKSNHVGSIIKYKDVSICLHQSIAHLGGRAVEKEVIFSAGRVKQYREVITFPFILYRGVYSVHIDYTRGLFMGLCRTNVMLDRELWKDAQEAGREDDRSGSWILNRALEQYLNKKKPKKAMTSKKFTDEDMRLASWMWGRVQKLNPTAKQPSLDKWADVIRLMREVDGRTLQDIGSAFDWANKDSFWCSNILSPDKLRKQFDRLKVKSNEASKSSNESGVKLSAAEQYKQQLRSQQCDGGAGRGNVSDSGLGQHHDAGCVRQQVASQDGTTIDLEAEAWRDVSRPD